MELNLVFSPEDGVDGNLETGGLGSPMGGKHQRDLSLSAKWANNKALALEYLQRQREAILWIESVLERQLPRDLFEALKSGIVLRELLAKLYPEPTTQCMSPISRRYSLTMAPWKERENISIFLKHCKSMGMNDTFLFCTDDLYEGTNMVQVLFSIQHFMAFSREKSKYLFKPIAHESLTFSNQELEMALSKIELAGVDVNALLTSAPPSTAPSAAPSPSKPHADEVTDDPSTPSTTNHDSDSHELETKEEQPAVDEEECAVDEADASSSHAPELTPSENNNSPSEDEMGRVKDMNDVGKDPMEDDQILIDEVADGPVEVLHETEVKTQLPDVVLLHEIDSEIQFQTGLNRGENDMPTQLELADTATDEEIFAFAAAELDECVVLLEIMEEMLKHIENSMALEEIKATEPVVVVCPEEIEVVRLSSAELTDNNGTYVGDSLAPTTADTNSPAEGETETPANRFSRAGRASKKASKGGKKKKRESSDEPLDTEAMSKCTCGSKCTIM